MLFNQNRKNSKNRFRTGNCVFVIILALLAMSLLAGCPNPAGTDDPGELDAPVLKATAQGIEITVIVPDGTIAFTIYRNFDSADMQPIFHASNFGGNIIPIGANTIIDYFVLGDKEYKYYCKLYFSDLSNTSTKTAAVTATGGSGELRITGTPTATYDAGKGVMTFTGETAIDPSVLPDGMHPVTFIRYSYSQDKSWKAQVPESGNEINIPEINDELSGETLIPKYWQVSLYPASGSGIMEYWISEYN